MKELFASGEFWVPVHVGMLTLSLGFFVRDGNPVWLLSGAAHSMLGAFWATEL